ncbi:hypothetical protein FXO37_35484 [Capsicum annuum]|nr:hypothetical protein FXO37_35484 [Capsicum annuum]
MECGHREYYTQLNEKVVYALSALGSNETVMLETFNMQMPKDFHSLGQLNKLTRLSVNANGSLIPKDCVDKNQIKKSPWLKALVAVPKVQPRFAMAIWKKYPTMKSLLHVYMDPSKSVHEKEFLLKDLRVEGLVSDDRRLGERCSKRVYRILMAQSGNSKTDEIECGADFFSQHSAE